MTPTKTGSAEMGEMKVVGHTPGPWRFMQREPCEVVLKRAHWVVGGGPQNKGVAIAFGGDDANAHLIAAAPELLAALLALADRVAVVIESDADDGKPEDAELRTAWDAAGVAIAKAEGR